MMITVILCLPVSIVLAEQSFCTEIQRYLRLTFGQEGLTGPVIIAFKGDTAYSFGNEKLIAT
jgi:hypothetical protein